MKGYKQTPEHVRKRIESKCLWYKHTEVTKNKIRNTILAKENYARWNIKYTVNEEIFNNINTPEKAYWLGFIAADGHVGDKTVAITLQARDVCQLEKFRDFLGSDIPIKTIKSGKEKAVRILVNRTKIVNTLRKLGYTRKKANNIVIPNISQIYHSDFIRGYFDGDGCLRRTNDKARSLQFSLYSSSRKLIEKTQLIFVKNLGLRQTKIHKKGNCFSFYYHGNNQVPKIFDYLLCNSNVRLERKYLALQEN